jgi:iron uptake system EfeUOB component EfeO/EfeM
MNKLDDNGSFGMYQLKKERSVQWLSSKQDVRKEIYKEKKKITEKAVMKATNGMWDKTCSKINCKLGFKRSREAWAILKREGERQRTSHKTKMDLTSIQDWYKCYSALLTKDRIECIEEEEWKI